MNTRWEQQMGQQDSAARSPRVDFVHHTWPAAPSQLAPIRAETRRFLAPLELADDLRHDLVLAVSEAASNAVEHAYRPAAAGDTVEVTFWTEPAALCIEIMDHGSWRTPSDEKGTRGMGLPLMHRVVDFVLIHYDARGTRVLLTHPVPGRARTLPVDVGSAGVR